MLNNELAKALIKKATSHTKHYATVVITANEQNTTRFANSEISQNIAITDANLTVNLYDGKKEVSCTTNILTDEGLKLVVQNAEEMLKYVPEGEFDVFPFSKEDVTETGKNDSLSKAFEVTERANYIKEGVAQIEAGFACAGALNLNKNILTVGDSEGGFRYSSYDEVTFNTVVTHIDGAAGAGECCSYTNPPDILEQFKKAQTTAKLARNPITPELGTHTVVLSPIAFADLIYYVAMSLNAKSVEDGISFATDKLGQKIFGKNLTMSDDCSFEGLRPLYFDIQGSPRQKLNLINNGVISAFAYDNKTATKKNIKSTGHAISTRFMGGAIPANVIVNQGNQSIEGIIKDTNNGVFINEFHYNNPVNIRQLQITGLTRNGTFLIEDGKLSSPISTVRFTESLLDAFNNISAISNTRQLVNFGFISLLVPAVRIDKFCFTSKA